MTPRVFLCEPQTHLSRAIAVQLLRADCQVWTCGSTGAALERLPKILPDLLLVDVDFPGKECWDVIQRVRSHMAYDGLKVIGLTARPIADAEHDAMRHGVGFDELISLPFSPRELRSRIAAWCGHGSSVTPAAH